MIISHDNTIGYQGETKSLLTQFLSHSISNKRLSTFLLPAIFFLLLPTFFLSGTTLPALLPLHPAPSLYPTPYSVEHRRGPILTAPLPLQLHLKLRSISTKDTIKSTINSSQNETRNMIISHDNIIGYLRELLTQFFKP